MLTLMAMNIQSARALLYHTSSLIDTTEAIRVYLASESSAQDPGRAALAEEFERNTQLIRFLTPLCKYYATEISNDVTRHGIQVHGGIGWTDEQNLHFWFKRIGNARHLLGGPEYLRNRAAELQGFAVAS